MKDCKWPISFNNLQLLLYMIDAKRTLNEYGADPTERYFYPTDLQYQRDAEECLRLLNELKERSFTEILNSAKEKRRRRL